jgi:hypothetical protein
MLDSNVPQATVGIGCSAYGGPMDTMNPDGAKPYWRDAEAVLADWASVEHDLSTIPVGSSEAARLHAEIERLRDEHQRLAQEARRHDDVLPSFPQLATSPAA